jgi:hypothetical protein
MPTGHDAPVLRHQQTAPRIPDMQQMQIDRSCLRVYPDLLRQPQETTMPINREIVDPNYPLVKLGVDPSTAIGAQILALRLRRYWLDHNLDVPAEVYVVQSRIDSKGGARCGHTVYSARVDFKAAKKVGEHQRIKLILSIEDEAGVYA